jgi:hypothetical protein
MEHTEVSFFSDGDRIAGYLYTPQDWKPGDAPRPGGCGVQTIAGGETDRADGRKQEHIRQNQARHRRLPRESPPKKACASRSEARPQRKAGRKGKPFRLRRQSLDASQNHKRKQSAR